MKIFFYIVLIFLSACTNDKNSSVESEFHPGIPMGVLVRQNNPTQGYGVIDLGVSNDITVTLKNTGVMTVSGLGASAFTTTSSSLFKGGSYPGTGGTCGATLAQSLTCDVVFTFLPLTTGTYSDSIVVSYHADDKGTQRTLRILRLTAVVQTGSPGGLVRIFNTTGILTVPFQQ